MATLEDVRKYVRLIVDVNGITTQNYSDFGEVLVNIEEIETAMMEEFGCGKSDLLTLPRNAELGPKASAALTRALQESSTDRCEE